MDGWYELGTRGVWVVRSCGWRIRGSGRAGPADFGWVAHGLGVVGPAIFGGTRLSRGGTRLWKQGAHGFIYVPGILILIDYP